MCYLLLEIILHHVLFHLLPTLEHDVNRMHLTIKAEYQNNLENMFFMLLNIFPKQHAFYTFPILIYFRY